MKPIVLDSSVAAKWFIEEEGRDRALRVLDQVRDRPERFLVPELFFNELLAVFCKVFTESKPIIEKNMKCNQYNEHGFHL